jgi:hypothetical protein
MLKSYISREICRNVTSTQVVACNDDENQAGATLSWCNVDESNNVPSCFYSINCCQYVDIPPRPDTSVPDENEQIQESSNLFGTEAEVNNGESQMGTSNGNNDATYPTPSPVPKRSSGVGVGIGFALVAIAIGALLVWKKEKKESDKDSTTGSLSKTGTIITSNIHNNPARVDEDPMKRRGNSSNRRGNSNGSVSSRRSNNDSVDSHNERKKRTIYDSGGSIDSGFIASRRISSDSEFSIKSIPL